MNRRKKAAIAIAYSIIAVAALAVIVFISISPESRYEIIFALCVELLGAAIVFVVLDRFVGSEDHAFDMGRRSSAVKVENLEEAIEELGRAAKEEIYLIDSYTNLEERLSKLISSRIVASKKLKIVIILLDPRSPLVDLRASSLDLSVHEMRQRISQCLAKFLRSRAHLPVKFQAQYRVFAYGGILGVAALRFDETIIFSHYLQDKATETSTWMDVRNGQSLFDDLVDHFEAIIKSDQAIELLNEKEVHGLLSQTSTDADVAVT